MHHSKDHGRNGRRGMHGAAARAETHRAPRHSGEPRRFSAANGDEAAPAGRSLGFAVVFLAAAALGGAALPFAFGEMFPRSFTATAIVGFDPAAASRQALDDMMVRLKAPESLDGVVSALDLAREPLVAGLQSPEDGGQGRGADNSRLRRTLTDMLDFQPNIAAARLSVSVMSQSPVLAVRIANAVASEGVNRTAVSALADEAGLAGARRAMENAEQAFADLAGGPDGEKLDKAARDLQRIESLDADIAAREAALRSLKDESARMARSNMSDLAAAVAASGPEAAQLDAARQKYMAAKLELDRLAVDLGTRHPRLVAAQAAAEETRQRLQEAIRQLEAGYRERVGAAETALKSLRRERGRLAPVAESGKAGVEELARLRSEAERLRTVYLEKLDAGQSENAVAAPAHIVAQASVETVTVEGVSPEIIAAGGALAGLAAAALWLYASSRRDEDDEDEDENERAAHVAADYDDDVDDGDADRFAVAPQRFARQPAEGSRDDGRRYEDHDRMPLWERDRDNFGEPLYRADQRHASREDYVYDEDGFWGPPPAENDDMPLADRLRLMLRRHAEMEAREADRLAADPRASEIEEIRRRMASLRERVESYGTRR